jgi:ParB/RepB/Spo0J family partition protein
MNIKKEFDRVSNIYLVELKRLSIPKDHDDVEREDYGDLDLLAQSLSKNGQEQPITIRTDGEDILVSDGSRRVKAAELANEKGYGEKQITYMDCILEQKGTTPYQRMISKLSANLSKEFTPDELGKTFKTMREKHGKSIAEIANDTCRSTTTVRDYIALVEAPEAIQEQVRKGRLKKTTAIKAIKKGDKAVESVTLQSELGNSPKGKDLDGPEPVLPEAPGSQVNNLDNMVKGFINNGWVLKSDALKDGTIGRYNTFANIGTRIPPRLVELVGR